MRILFMGTPDFAVASLSALLTAGHDVCGVFTQPDKPKNRGMKLQASPVKEFALAHNIPVFQPVKMRDGEAMGYIRDLDPALIVVAAYGRILPDDILNYPPHGCINVHSSLLPRYRGAAPINWAIINGERQTGVTTFFLDHDIDTGRIIMQEPFEIKDDYDVEDVYDGLMKLGADVALKTVDKIIEGDGHVDSLPQERLIPTDGRLHAAPKIFKDTCRIRLDGTACRVRNFVRGLSPYPGTWLEMKSHDGKASVLKVFKTTLTGIPCNGKEPGTIMVYDGRLLTATADCWLQLDEIQLSGKKRMAAKDFLNGIRNIEDYKLF